MDSNSHHEWRHAQIIACGPTTPWLASETGEGFAFDAYEESRSSSPPWCRRRPALLEDDEGSLSRGQEEKLYDYYGIS